MWDDHTVAWEICAPWFERSTHFRSGRWHPPLVTIWHVDPQGDRGWPCGDPNDRRRLWRFHVHHWKLQVHPWQDFKRFLFERCAECGRGYPWGYAPVSHGKGTVHHECSSLIHHRDQNEQLRGVVRAAIGGYCRTAEMSPREAIDVLIPGRDGRLPEWRTHHLARQVVGCLDEST